MDTFLKQKQNRLFEGIATYANQVFTTLLDKDDMITIYGVKKLLRSSGFIKANATAYLNEHNASIALFIAINMGVVTYQYAYASWFLYLVTTISGIKKLYHVIFKNPIMGIFFFASFYFKVLEGTADEQKFNAIATSLKLPKHKDFTGQKFITSVVNEIPDLIGFKVSGFRKTAKKTMRTVAGIVISGQVENIGVNLNNTMFETAISTPEISEVNHAAIYITPHDIFEESDLQEYSEFVEKNIKQINKAVKDKVGGKNKHQRKMELQQVIERRTETGEVICLNQCKKRVKTRMGCYCEGDCGKTFMVGKQSWCYVDPTKCKRGKALPKYNGYSWDRCDTAKLSKNCWTGVRWKECYS